MNKKSSKTASVEEIMKKELSVVIEKDKIEKLEKERSKDKKIIAEYKEREKATARALVLYERKLKYLKETLTAEMLKLCQDIENVKETYEDVCTKILNVNVREEVLAYKNNFAYYMTEIYELCNKLEQCAMITKQDRAFISNKQVKEDKPVDANSRFDRLKQEFALKVGSSVNRKPGRPRKGEQSIVADIGLGKKVEKVIETDNEVENRLNEIFYQAPQLEKQVVSSIPTTSDSVFDFNEALNPNVSLKDIMADLLSDKDDEDVKEPVMSEERQELDDAQQKAKIELLESGFIRNPVMQSKTVNNRTIDPLMKKPTFEKRFLSIQNIVKDTK